MSLHPPVKTTSLPATLWVPEFLRLDEYELRCVLHVLRDPLATHVYLLLLAHSDFKTGEFLGGYHRLMELCTPPQPERGRRRPGPSYDTLRRVIDDLIKLALASRDATRNSLQGQLRLKLMPRKSTVAPTQISPTKSPKVEGGKNQEESKTYEEQAPNKDQDKDQGYQGLNTSFNGSKTGELSTTVEDSTRPPEGAQNGPQAPGQVAASPLMAGKASAISEKGRQELEKLHQMLGKKKAKQPPPSRDEIQQRLNKEAAALKPRQQAE